MKSLFKKQTADREAEILRFTISHMTLQPGDIIVLRHPGKLLPATVDNLRKIVHEVLGGRKCLVLEQGLDIGILSNAEIERQLGRTEEAA